MSSISDEDEDHETSESVDVGKHGKDYEIQISKYLMKRLLDANFVNFKFTREKKGLGKFDDLTYIYETKSNERKYCLVQLKHIRDTTKKICFNSLAIDAHSYFWLQKYFSHYDQSLGSIKHDKDFADAELESLIICTNIGFEDNLGSIKKHQVSNAGLFSNFGKYYRLEISEVDRKVIFAESYYSDQQKLANELVHYIMYDKAINVNTLKKDEHVSMINTYHVALAEHVIDISTRKFQDDFLEGTTYQESEVTKFRNVFFECLKTFCEICTEDGSKENVRTPKLTLKLKSQLSELNSFNSYDEFLQAQSVRVCQNFGKKSNPLDIVTLPTGETSDSVVDQKIKTFLNLLIFATLENQNENIIREEMDPQLFIAYNDQMNIWYHSGSYQDNKTSSLRKRRWITKEKILTDLMERLVVFQGKDEKLKSLMADKSLVCPNTLLKSFCSMPISIGRAAPTLEDTKDFYISRSLRCQKQISKEALENCKSDVFLISNTFLENFNNTIKHLMPQTIYKTDMIDYENHHIFLVLKSFDQKMFQQITNDLALRKPRLNVHWLELHKNQLCWLATYGSLKNLRKYITCPNRETKTVITEHNLACTHDNLIVVSGEPGMGKTTLLKSVAENIKNKCNEYSSNSTEELSNWESKENYDSPIWVISISLKDCSECLKEVEKFEDIKSVVTFLAAVEKIEDGLPKTLLDHYVREGRRLVLMIDGFDEIQSDEQEEKIIQLVNVLREDSFLKQIWITTRPHLAENLELSLNVISYPLKEISESEQALFFAKYIQSKRHLSTNINFFTGHEVIARFNKTLSGQNRGFLGVPLHTFMFASVYLQLASKGEEHILDSLPITMLFENFLQSKYDIYFKKSGDDFLLTEKRQNFLRNLLDDAHQDFALSYSGILSSSEAKIIGIKSHTFDDDDLLDIGIVYRVKDEYHFSNQTFAEYLVAKKLVEICTKDKDKVKNKLIIDILLKRKNNFLLYLFDLKLTENLPLHRAILTGKHLELEKFSTTDMNAEDSVGRRPLYYALHYRNEAMIDILINNGALIKGNDNFSARALFETTAFRNNSK